MFRNLRSVAFVTGTLLALSGAVVAAEAASPVKRLGRTVVQRKDDKVKAILSWRFANQTFGKEPWMLLELAFASEGSSVELNREDVSLVLPGGERVPLPGQRRLAEGLGDVQWLLQRASVSRDPLTGYFSHQTYQQRLPFFTWTGGPVVLDEISGGPSMLTIGDLFFEAPTGSWKPGTYALALKNRTMDVELPFSLPADVPEKESKEKDPKAVTW